MSWIVTIALVLFLARIIYLEVVCGRRSKAFFKKTGEDIQQLTQQVTASYRAKYGRDPTGTFPLTDGGDLKK